MLVRFERASCMWFSVFKLPDSELHVLFLVIFILQLRILKRPDSGGTNNLKNQESSKEKPAHKTLAERQAQYAEAR